MSLMEEPWRWAPSSPALSGQSRVCLVGAGPGDPELLTLKAWRALQMATHVLYDHLVSDAVLELIPPGTVRIDVGKRSGRHPLPQADIQTLMLDLVAPGRVIVRLKGGDGYIFGRGGEEAEALAEAGVPFEVIPGITAAQGAAASTGIPLTHRDHASALMLATAHGRDDEAAAVDWTAAARAHQTVVFYMGVGRLAEICARLVAAGRAADTPAAIVERATQPDERCIVGTLADLAERARQAQVRPPALVIVGEVVALRARLARGRENLPATADTKR